MQWRSRTQAAHDPVTLAAQEPIIGKIEKTSSTRHCIAADLLGRPETFLAQLSLARLQQNATFSESAPRVPWILVPSDGADNSAVSGCFCSTMLVLAVNMELLLIQSLQYHHLYGRDHLRHFSTTSHNSLFAAQPIRRETSRSSAWRTLSAEHRVIRNTSWQARGT